MRHLILYFGDRSLYFFDDDDDVYVYLDIDPWISVDINVHVE